MSSAGSIRRDMPDTPLKTVYLAHPFNNRDLGLQIQRKFEAANIAVINPFIRGEQKEYENVIKSLQEFSMDQNRRIVIGDLRKIKAVDAVVAVIPAPSIGTSMEDISASFWMFKPVFALYLVEGRYLGVPANLLHPWIGYLNVVVRDADELVNEVIAWANGGPLPEHFKEFPEYRKELIGA